MQKQKHLAIEIVPHSDMDDGPTTKQFATLDVSIFIRQDNQSDKLRDHKTIKIGATHQPAGQDTIDAALAVGDRMCNAQAVIDGMLQVIIDFIEQLTI